MTYSLARPSLGGDMLGHAAQRRHPQGPTTTTAALTLSSLSQVLEQNGLPDHLMQVTHDAGSKSSELLIHVTMVSVRLFEYADVFLSTLR